jgi:hypothetical protein
VSSTAEEAVARRTETQRFSGDIEGDGSVEWLLCYLAAGGACYVGLQRIEGSLAGRKGSFVIEAVGRFDGGASSGSWAVIEGSGTDELAASREKAASRPPAARTRRTRSNTGSMKPRGG